MSKIIHFEWDISRLYVDSSEVSDESPNKIKLLKAIDFLRAAELCTKKKEIIKLENNAWNTLLPMELEVNYSGGDLFAGSEIIIEITDKNTDWNIWIEDESIGLNLSVKFEIETMKNATEKNFDLWERKFGWDWIGVSIAKEGYEMDSGSNITASFVEE